MRPLITEAIKRHSDFMCQGKKQLLAKPFF